MPGRFLIHQVFVQASEGLILTKTLASSRLATQTTPQLGSKVAGVKGAVAAEGDRVKRNDAVEGCETSSLEDRGRELSWRADDKTARGRARG